MLLNVSWNRIFDSMTGNLVCVIGVWHLGAVYSTCLADLGNQVIGVDKDIKRVEELNKGIPALFEPGLSESITANIERKRLSYTTEIARAVKGSRLILITLDTPVDENDEVDLSEIFFVSHELAYVIENGSIIIVSSQVPVGTCEQIKGIIQRENPSLEFDIACAPENLRLGQALDIFRNPERIVIGADNPSTLDKVEQLFSPLGVPMIKMNLKSAEMTKHALNAFLATSVSFANEIANLCDAIGADALKVGEALRSDSRIGAKARLSPGIGFAGATLARDIKVLQHLGTKLGLETPLINGVLKVNERQNEVVIRKLKKTYSSLNGLTIAILGLTYKPGTSTMRRSAALEIIKELIHEGAKIKAYDPRADLSEVKNRREFVFCSDPYQTAIGADALVIITEWPEFKDLKFDLIKESMNKPVILDTKNLLCDGQLSEKGFIYFGIGRGK